MQTPEERAARWKEYMRRWRTTSKGKEAGRRYYQKNKGKYQEQYKLNRDLVWKLKEETSCSVCGEKKPWRLEFHHVDPDTKKFNITSHGSRTGSLLEELEKCIVLCANCHCDLHYERDGNGDLIG